MDLKLILVALPVLTGCLTIGSASPTPRRGSTTLHEARTPMARGVVVVVHGLNHRSDAMTPWAEVLTGWGYHVVRVSLSGHDRSVTRYGVSTASWEAEVRSACLATRRRFSDQPLFLLGYSLGATLLLSVADEGQLDVSGMVLLAPAIELRWYAQLGRAVAWLRGTKFAIPSAAPRSSRVFAWTSADAYAGLYGAVDGVAELTKPRRLGRIPTLVAISDDDESLDSRDTLRWIEKHELTAWRFVPVEPLGAPAHLIVDEAILGESEWNRLLEHVKHLLTSTSVAQ